MTYIHDPYPELSKRPYQRAGLGRDPLALPWEGDPAVYETYGPYIGAGMKARVPPPYRPVGAGELAGFGITTLAVAAAALWIGYQVLKEKPRK